jgi:hypothetical protein
VLGRLLEHLQEGVEGLGGQHVDLVDDVELREPADGGEVTLSLRSLISSIPRLEAASISTTSSEELFTMARQLSQVPSGSAVGPAAQFSPIASTFAVEVFPVPRGPLKR